MKTMIDPLEAYLPASLVALIPPADRWWRVRTVLVLWTVGHSLREAWAFAMNDDPRQVAFYRETMGRIDDRRIIADLEATARERLASAAWP